jgi:Tfp pilus assembly protein PilV
MTNDKLQITNLGKGQSLFEVVVAVAISALIIVAIVSLAINSIQNSDYSRNKTLASTYSQQATEWLRGQRDSGPDAFFSTHTIVPAPGGYCLPALTWTQLVADTVHECNAKIPGTVFTRWVTFNRNVQNGKMVVETDVTVSWSDSQGVHEITDATNLSDSR